MLIEPADPAYMVMDVDSPLLQRFVPTFKNDGNKQCINDLMVLSVSISLRQRAYVSIVIEPQRKEDKRYYYNFAKRAKLCVFRYNFKRKTAETVNRRGNWLLSLVFSSDELNKSEHKRCSYIWYLRSKVVHQHYTFYHIYWPQTIAFAFIMQPFRWEGIIRANTLFRIEAIAATLDF